jgi:phosphoribosyl-ATP pyrophosphohydrolase
LRRSRQREENSVTGLNKNILQNIADILETRKTADPASSYTAALYAKGLDAILKKVGEEAVETILAGRGEDDAHLINEVADLWFHTLVLLAAKELKPDAVLAELQRRFGQSGIDEKAARAKR